MGELQKIQYVKEQITQAFISLLHEKELKDISVSEITRTAQVSRVSFYRNYSTKEDILREYTGRLLRGWGAEFERSGAKDIDDMFGSLFAHFKANSEYYLLLYRRGLSQLLLNAIKEICGSKPDQTNHEAYTASFFAHGLYGWIDEWFARGMQESADTMVALLKSVSPNSENK